MMNDESERFRLNYAYAVMNFCGGRDFVLPQSVKQFKVGYRGNLHTVWGQRRRMRRMCAQLERQGFVVHECTVARRRSLTGHPGLSITDPEATGRRLIVLVRASRAGAVPPEWSDGRGRGGGTAGVREPRRPRPSPNSGHIELDLD